MILPHKDRNKVRLVPSSNKIVFDNDMPLFDTSSMLLIYADENDPGKGIRMVMRMKRKITTEMMTTYLPSTLLLLITFATTFFKPYFFEAALTVNLTTMLVMTTIFISKMEGLPPTSDIKMIDIWLVFCQLVPFAQVVLLTAMEYIREEEKEVEKQEEYPETARGKENESDKKGDELNAADEPQPLEAWIPINTEPNKTDNMHKLLTIGNLFRWLRNQNHHSFFIAEKKLMPLTVLAAFIVYICTAIGFYYG